MTMELCTVLRETRDRDKKRKKLKYHYSYHKQGYFNSEKCNNVTTQRLVFNFAKILGEGASVF